MPEPVRRTRPATVSRRRAATGWRLTGHNGPESTRGARFRPGRPGSAAVRRRHPHRPAVTSKMRERFLGAGGTASQMRSHRRQVMVMVGQQGLPVPVDHVEAVVAGQVRVRVQVRRRTTYALSASARSLERTGHRRQRRHGDGRGKPLLPRQSVNREVLRPSEAHTTCPWKGQASYYTLEADRRVNRDAAWYYESPSLAAAQDQGT